MPPLAPIYRHVGNRLRVLRNARELTQAELAEEIGRGTEYLGKVERGEKRIQLEDLTKVVGALDVSLSEFFHGVAVSGPLAREARERRSKYEAVARTQPVSDDVVTLMQIATTLDQADVEALIAVAQRMVAAGFVRRGR
jgi:transcriptional regulator with XRE-family HTH domain